jgi:hypothetical protein
VYWELPANKVNITNSFARIVLSHLTYNIPFEEDEKMDLSGLLTMISFPPFFHTKSQCQRKGCWLKHTESALKRMIWKFIILCKVSVSGAEPVVVSVLPSDLDPDFFYYSKKNKVFL